VQRLLPVSHYPLSACSWPSAVFLVWLLCRSSISAASIRASCKQLDLDLHLARPPATLERCVPVLLPRRQSEVDLLAGIAVLHQ
jgi:hypothetical protein